MSIPYHITVVDGDGVLYDDRTDLLAIELALQNPQPGTPAALTLEKIAARARERDSQLFPSIVHPISGALCFCQTRCTGAHCHCWCHAREAV
jgi:hypothetical protein